MITFPNLTWVCGHIGFANDSLTIFLNLHYDQNIRYNIIRNRMRTSRPGVLLNWAWYYPKWRLHQQSNPLLYKAIDNSVDGDKFLQVHFFNRENLLLEKFPGSRALTILVSDLKNAEFFVKMGHYKLLDKLLHPSWYLLQKQNFPIKNLKNNEIIDKLFKQGLTVLQYRSMVYQDWQNKLVTECIDPIAEWNSVKYHENFMENSNTVFRDHANWTAKFDQEKQIPIYIDKLICTTPGPNTQYYLELCDQLQLIPNLELFQSFWSFWLANQPNIDNYTPMTSWDNYRRSILTL